MPSARSSAPGLDARDGAAAVGDQGDAAGGVVELGLQRRRAGHRRDRTERTRPWTAVRWRQDTVPIGRTRLGSPRSAAGSGSGQQASSGILRVERGPTGCRARGACRHRRVAALGGGQLLDRLGHVEGHDGPATCGGVETTSAMRSAVRSCSSRPTIRDYVRRGQHRDLGHPRRRPREAASSIAARRMRRSGTSMISSGMSAAWEASHSRRSFSAYTLSTIRWTARSSAGRSERA